jgi:ABC-type glycerol-3-phosphate transport system substrate-binding protein
MRKLNSKLVLMAALSAALLAGCGGGGGSSDSAGQFGFGGVNPIVEPPVVTNPVGQTIASLFDYISRLIASNGENTDPVDINGFTLATDETSSPTPLP